MGLEILKIIQNNPGIRVNGVFTILKELNGKVGNMLGNTPNATRKHILLFQKNLL